MVLRNMVLTELNLYVQTILLYCYHVFSTQVNTGVGIKRLDYMVIKHTHLHDLVVRLFIDDTVFSIL